jgi:glycerophosphoryl diester phosphodiesterase
MDTVKFDKKETKVIAHRGLSGIERENTCPAFVAAGNRSYYGIETDIHVGFDGEYIVSHDNRTARVSEGAFDIDVEQTPYDAIRELILPDRDGSFIRQDIRIPVLEEYISICKKYEKTAVLEIKGGFSESSIIGVIRRIKLLGYLDGVIFISFDHNVCLTVRRLLPEARVQFLTCDYDDTLPERLEKERLDLDIHYSALTEERIKALHGRGIKVNCWTVDDPEVAERLASWGIDFITSNILE